MLISAPARPKSRFRVLAAYAASKSALNTLSLVARSELEQDNIIVSLVYPYITATEFHKNLLKSKLPAGFLPQGHPPELVASYILKAIQTGEAEIVIGRE